MGLSDLIRDTVKETVKTVVKAPVEIVRGVAEAGYELVEDATEDKPKRR